MSLPPIPEAAFRRDDFSARQGAYAGCLHEVRWGYPKGWLRSQARRALIRRRWFQVLAFTEDLALVFWIRDEGMDGGAAVWVVDRHSGRTLARATANGRPLASMAVGPFSGWRTDAWIRAGRDRLALRRADGASHYTLEGRLEGVALAVTLDVAGAAPITVIGEHAPRRPGLTTKWNLAPVRGHVTVGGQEHALDGGLGALTYTNGFFPSGVRWVELTALGRLPDGSALGLGLASGNRHGAVQEHVLWRDGAVVGGGPALVLPGDGGGWRIVSADRTVDLTFDPLATDHEPVTRTYGATEANRMLGVLRGEIHPPGAPKIRLNLLPALVEAHGPLGGRSVV